MIDQKSIETAAAAYVEDTNPEAIAAAVQACARLGIHATNESMINPQVADAFAKLAVRTNEYTKASAAFIEEMNAAAARRLSEAALAYANAWQKLSRAVKAASR